MVNIHQYTDSSLYCHIELSVADYLHIIFVHYIHYSHLHLDCAFRDVVDGTNLPSCFGSLRLEVMVSLSSEEKERPQDMLKVDYHLFATQLRKGWWG